MILSLALIGIAMQAAPKPDSAALLPATKIDATKANSVAKNILDTKMNETPVKGGIIRVGMIHRENAEAKPLMHSELSEIYQILEGSGTMMTGGTMPNPQPVHDPDNLGPTPSYQGDAVGGKVIKVGPRDVVVVPAGMPHKWITLDGPINYVIYRFEPAQASGK